jgi:hypothetical protein
MQGYITLLESQLEEERDEIRAMSEEFADWRDYIHKLERKLKLPLSGVERSEQPPTTSNGAGAEDPEPSVTERSKRS